MRKVEVDQGFDLPKSCYGAFIEGRFSCDQSGYTVQGGCAWDPTDHHELSARYSWIDNDRDLEDDERTEATLNYAYYFFRHTMQLFVSVSYFDLGVNAEGLVQLRRQGQQPHGGLPGPDGFPGARWGQEHPRHDPVPVDVLATASP